MKSPELALMCSSSPGFFRSLGSALGEHFRLLECYTIQESAQMMHLHQPKLAIIDLRGSLPTQVARTWATAQSAATTRFVIVTNPGQISDSDIPVEIHQRVNIHSLQPGEEAIQLLIQHVIAIGENPTEKNRTLSPLHSKVTEPTPETSSTSASAVAESGNRSHAAPAGSKRDSGPTAVPDDEPASGMSDKFRTRTPELRSMLRRLEIAARHNVTILLIGETGAGKTHLARLIHDVSPRAGEPFLHLACGALPGDLIESELFGHVKGAFTSAHADKDGKFLAAGNGTILLDEIDVLSPEQQVKLLRVIEKGEFEPVGSNRTLHVKARIIAASNLQLQPLVEQGLFRPDLYYRLNTLSFHLPPLRKRLPDIEPLARFFVHQHATQLGVEIREIAPEFIECLLHYPWPGNVREMENAIRSAVIYSDHGVMKPSALPQHVVEGMAGPGNDPSVSAFFAVRQGDSLGNRIELTEKDIIEQALLKNNFSRTNTARHLGISRVTLYNKMRKYGIMPER